MSRPPTPAPEITVVIPCHDAEAFVEEAVESVLRQEGVSVELIVVDDASRDGSRERIRRYGDALRSVSLDENRGAAHARNRGAALARGRAILFLDADDRLRPGALLPLSGATAARPGCVAVSSWGYLRWEGGRWVEAPRDRPLPAGDDPLLEWLRGCWVPTCSVLWSRDAFRRTGGWDETLTLNDDGDLVFRALILGVPLVVCEGPGGVYRRHAAAGASLNSGVLSEGRLRSQAAVLDRVGEALGARGRREPYRSALARIERETALLAFRAGLPELGRQRLGRAGGNRGAVGRTLPGRLATRLLGLERKERLVSALRGLGLIGHHPSAAPPAPREAR
jgi:O-antigen biosynthesis protein